jgi:transcriptional regulator GlxA family with amidase domain
VPGESCAGRFDPEIAWLRRCYGEGAMLATACSGAVLLAEAGLLDGREATIHWGYTASLAANYSDIKVNPARSLVLDGEAQRIIMAGGGTSWQDLALYLIARFVGLKEAMEVSRINLIAWHDIGQQPFASLITAKQTNDEAVVRCQEWVALNYAEANPVAAMSRLCGLPERSFVRRFSRATGLAPLNYVHAVRLEEAKQLLETSDLPVEAIANEVGYEDASFFGRLFRRKVGITPARYRRRFGSLRKVLQARGPGNGRGNERRARH